MLSSNDLYTSSRLCSRILGVYNSNYYRLNGYIESEFGQSIMRQLVMQESNSVVNAFVQKHGKDAKDINDLVQLFDADMETAGKKAEVAVKLRLALMGELDKEKQILAVRNLVAVKTLARFIGQNMQPKLQEKEEYKINEQASMSKKFVAVNKVIVDLLDEFPDKSVEQLNQYVKDNIDTLVTNTLTEWDTIPDFNDLPIDNFTK